MHIMRTYCESCDQKYNFINIFVSNIEELIKLTESADSFKKLEAIMNHFNALGKFIIVNIHILYFTCEVWVQIYFFFIRKSMMNCQMLLSLQMLYLNFQSISFWLQLKHFQMRKYYLLIRISEYYYHHRIWKTDHKVWTNTFSSPIGNLFLF